MRFKVFGILDKDGWVDDGSQRLGGQISAMKGLEGDALLEAYLGNSTVRLLPLKCCVVRLHRVVLVELALDIVVDGNQLLT